MKLARRDMLRLGAAAAALPCLPEAAAAQTYPTRPVRIVVPYPVGIAPDIATRLLAEGLSQRLKQQFIVDNRPGGAANIGTQIVVKAAPDGYTLLTSTMTNVLNMSLYDSLDFNFLRDLVPVSGLVLLPLVLVVNPSVPAKTLPEFIAYAKKNPGKINFASVGSGAATDVAGELFNMMAGTHLVNVPYRSSYLPDLLSGQVQVGFTPVLQTISFIRAENCGRWRRPSRRARKCCRIFPPLPSSCRAIRRSSGTASVRRQDPAGYRQQAQHRINAVLNDPADAEKIRRSRRRGDGDEPRRIRPVHHQTKPQNGPR